MNHSHAPAIIDELCTSLCSLLPACKYPCGIIPILRPERRFASLVGLGIRGVRHAQLTVTLLPQAVSQTFRHI